MKVFCFTVDDNIRFLKDINSQNFKSIFEHPYLAMLRRLHERFEIKVQLNMFYQMEGFELSEASDRYACEWQENSDWLKFSFHSRKENYCPYENSDYNEVFCDCKAVNQEILRISSPDTLAKTTTVHYCLATAEGLKALSDNGVKGLLGLFGSEEETRISYNIDENTAYNIRCGEIVSRDGLAFASIDMIINKVEKDDIISTLSKLLGRRSLRVMIHEQYFYEDYKAYQPDFEEKLTLVFGLLSENGYRSCFFEELI